MTIDQYKPRYLVRQELDRLDRQRAQEERRDDNRLAMILAGVICLTLAFPLYRGVRLALELYEKSSEEVVKMVENYQSLDLDHGSGHVTIVWDGKADIHHIIKKLELRGYKVSSTRSKGIYSGGKVFRFGNESFGNEFDLYDYLNKRLEE